MRLFFIVILFTFINCSTGRNKENELEKELDSISEKVTRKELSEEKFKHFFINWDSPNKWESDCETYDIIPKRDTFQNVYYLDFCYDKFRWWERNEKRSEDLNMLRIGFESISILQTNNKNIYLDIKKSINYEVPTFIDTIISFDPIYYYEKYELNNQNKAIQEDVVLLDELKVKQLNISKPIQLITEKGIFDVKSFSLKVIRKDTSYERIFNLDFAMVDSLGKSDLYEYGFNWLLKDIRENDDLVISELVFKDSNMPKIEEKILLKLR